MPMACRISVPLAPSTNGLHFNMPGKGRVSTPEYRQWKRDAGWLVQAAPKASFAGRFRVLVLIPEKMRGDADNRLKACCDLLVSHRVIPDDRYAWEAIARRDPSVKPDECILIVESAA